MNMLPPFLTMSTVSMSSDDIIINGDTGQDHHCTEPEVFLFIYIFWFFVKGCVFWLFLIITIFL